MGGILTESQVMKIWQEQLSGRTDLVTEEGGTVRIVYPGRPNDDRGADLRDAVIATGGGMRRGDIEVHVNSSNWREHRHHRDPLYNRVILHVVYRHDVADAAVLEDGRRVPTLALERYIGDRGGRPSSIAPVPCRDVSANRDMCFLGGVLDAAGDRRFADRVTEYRGELSGGMSAGQRLYEGIMEALGYTKNKIPMRELARRVPLERVMAAADAAGPDEEGLVRCQALLMGTAGLLPSQRAGGGCSGEGWVGRLEVAWAASGETAVMSAGDWRFFKIRPGNFPGRRIAAMSYLLLRYRQEGLLSGLVRGLESSAPDNIKGGMEKSLTVAAEGYWGRHLDLGLRGVHGIPALLGENRANVIAANVILPFARAWGQTGRHPELAEKSLEMYRIYPVLAENTLEKHMRRQLRLSRVSVNSARRQQGLIHIYKTLCSQGKCGECPLGQD